MVAKIEITKSIIPKDEFGPEYIINVYDPQIGMEGFLVIDNTVLGMAKGGIRMTPNVTAEEVWRLARAMTWKNSLAGIPFGGGKAGIIWPPAGATDKVGGENELKKQFVQSFAKAIKIFTPKKYIAGPDVNTGEKEMKWFVEATGDWNSATGKPENLCVRVLKDWQKCGIPHEAGSTGFGVAHATKVAVEALKLNIKDVAVAIHGFGNVGTFTYKFLTEMGAKVIAIADHSGAIFCEDGFDEDKIGKLIASNQKVAEYTGKAKKVNGDDFWAVPADILIPASITDVIHEGNKDRINAKIIVEAANIPMRENIEKELFKRGILIVPDFVANSGGVISSYSEYKGHYLKKMFQLVEEKITKSTKQVLKESLRQNKNPREVAVEIAKKRILAKINKKNKS